MQQYCPPATKLALKSNKRYHVFLSFRGEDVRKTLVDHLFQALSAAGLNVFLDSEKLVKGEMIGLSLEAAIECSAICIPIFSKGYADSSWCLREATAILKSPGLIIPLFYHVKPNHVRYPECDSSPYKQSFLKHYRHTGRHPREEIEWWKYALKQICDHSGWSMEIDDGFLTPLTMIPKQNYEEVTYIRRDHLHGVRSSWQYVDYAKGIAYYTEVLQLQNCIDAVSSSEVTGSKVGKMTASCFHRFEW